MRTVLTSLFYKHKINYTGIRNYAKEIKFGSEGKNLLLKGAETLANVISVTLGPKGRSVIVGEENPKISKDGIFVANSIALDDSYENVGAQIMKKMADSTQKEVNNGTKSATILAIEMARQGNQFITKGSNPVQIRQGILDAVDTAIKYLDKITQRISNREDIAKVATIFAEGDEKLGATIADALVLVGKDGVITVKETECSKDTADLARGIILESGINIANYPLDKSGHVKLESAFLGIYKRKIEHFNSLIPILELAIAKHKPLVIIAEDFSADVKMTFALNNEAIIGIKCLTVKIPNDKEFDENVLKDLAFTFGGKIVGDEACGKKINKINDSYLGEVPEIILTKTEMICIHGDNTSIRQKIDDLNNELKSIEKDDYDKKRLQERLNRLESSIAIISIDGNNKEEAKKQKEKIYTIIENTKVAMEEGVVPGGGLAFLRCTEAIKEMKTTSDDYKLGIKILLNSLSAPFNTIIKNSHENPAPILYKLQSQPYNIGYDIVSGKIVDVFESGIVDPTKAVKLALKNAANTASLMMNAEAVVVYKFDGNEIVL